MAFDLENEDKETALTEEVQQSESQSQEQTQAQTQETPVFDAQKAYQGLQDEFKGFGRQLGQVGTFQSKLDRLTQLIEGQRSQNNNQSQTDFLGKYTPEQIAESKALIAHFGKEIFGDKLTAIDKLNEFQQNYSFKESASTVEQIAKNVFGEDFEKYTPSMNAVGKELWEASQRGDTRAQRILDLMKSDPETGGELFTALAQRHYMTNVQNQSAQATNAQANRGKKAAGTVAGGAQRTLQARDPSKMSVEELRTFAEQENIEGRSLVA